MAGTGGDAHAALIKFHYSGTITFANPSSGVAIGTPFSGTFAYDPTAMTTVISITPGGTTFQYGRSTNGTEPPSLAELTAIVGGQTILSQADGLTVSNYGSGAGGTGVGTPRTALQISNEAGSSALNLSVSLSFLNFDRPVYANDDPPTSIMLNDFPVARFEVHPGLTNPGGPELYEGIITSLDTVPVPEPATLGLLASGLGLCLACRRHLARSLAFDWLA